MIWEKYEKTVNGMAWSFCVTGACPLHLLEDLRLEGALFFVLACKSYNPDNPYGASFGTYLRTFLRNEMINWCRHQQIERSVFSNSEEDYSGAPCPEQAIMFLDYLTSYSKEAKTIVKAILLHQEEIYKESKNLSPKNLRSAVTRTLRQHKIKWKSIEWGIRDLKTALREAW